MSQDRSNQNGGLDFQQLLELASQGNETAAAQLVRDFEPEVRRFVRFRLANSNLRQFVDSMDICQSALGQFFVELAGGRTDLQSPKQLRNFLLKIAQNRMYSKGRYQNAARRDIRRREAVSRNELESAVSDIETPSELVASSELVHLIRAKLPEDTRYLVEQRLSGREWGDLAQELGISADAARKRMARALDEVASELGLIEL